MAKGQESIQDKLQKITRVIEVVEENPKSYRTISEIKEKLDEIKEKIEFQFLYWEPRSKNSMGFFKKIKARKKVRELQSYQSEVDFLLLRYENLVEIRSKQ